jgi:hypothetical protein
VLLDVECLWQSRLLSRVSALEFDLRVDVMPAEAVVA